MSRREKIKAKFKQSVDVIVEWAETFFVGLFIVNGTIASGILLNLFEVSAYFSDWIGAITFSYTIVAFVIAINFGVKHLLNNRGDR